MIPFDHRSSNTAALNAQARSDVPTATMDATTSFEFLTDNLPQWIQQAQELSVHASQKHAEYVAEYSRRLAFTKPAKPRTPSLDSFHSHREAPLHSSPQHLNLPSQSTPEPSTPDALHISPLEAGNKYLVAQAQRKRKLSSSIRSGASGPQKFRSKHMAVIFYDAYLQEQLDGLVKSIGGARNNLRKGKLSRSATRGFQLPYVRRATDPNGNGVPPTNGYKRALTPPITISTEPAPQLVNPTPTADEAFANADKHLEAAQNLCETAAHQVLRDGDCSIELTSVVTKLHSVLELAIAAVAQLREEHAEQEEEEQGQKQSEVTSSADPPSPQSLAHSSTSRLVPSLNEKMDFSPAVLPTTSGGVTEIEVDDSSDQESIVVDITKFRTARMTRSQGLQI
jgi:hypothetical protein